MPLFSMGAGDGRVWMFVCVFGRAGVFLRVGVLLLFSFFSFCFSFFLLFFYFLCFLLSSFFFTFRSLVIFWWFFFVLKFVKFSVLLYYHWRFFFVSLCFWLHILSLFTFILLCFHFSFCFFLYFLLFLVFRYFSVSVSNFVLFYYDWHFILFPVLCSYCIAFHIFRLLFYFSSSSIPVSLIFSLVLLLLAFVSVFSSFPLFTFYFLFILICFIFFLLLHIFFFLWFSNFSIVVS